MPVEITISTPIWHPTMSMPHHENAQQTGTYSTLRQEGNVSERNPLTAPARKFSGLISAQKHVRLQTEYLMDLSQLYFQCCAKSGEKP